MANFMGKALHPLAVLAIAVSIGCPCCVPWASISGSPCPCPAGYACCETLASCIPYGDDCPGAYPPSTRENCVTDGDCGTGEICYSWSTPEHGNLGPGICRRECALANPCATGENCELALHGGAPMAELNVAYMCLPEVSIVGCEDKRCSTCTQAQLGGSWCGESEIQGCFFALHPLCGLSCQVNTILDCDPLDCIQNPFGPTCEGVDGPDGGTGTYYEINCDMCPQGVAPGESACAGNSIETCWMANEWCPDCDDICYLEIIDCPAGWTCDDENGAVCMEP